MDEGEDDLEEEEPLASHAWETTTLPPRRRVLLGVVQTRNLATKLTDAETELVKILVKNKQTLAMGLAKAQATPDADAEAALSADTGGPVVLTPFQSCNVDGTTLEDVPSPMATQVGTLSSRWSHRFNHPKNPIRWA